MEVFKNSLTKIEQNRAVISMSGIESIEIGPPAQYGGSPDTLNPEELFVGSINGCIMLVFYHFAKKYGLTVHRYNSIAEGTVEKTKDGLRFTKVLVNAKIERDGADHTGGLEEIKLLAEKHCLVSNSVSCPVIYTVEVMTKGETNSAPLKSTE
jgi:organic hydroperoxide reductase OsmC/OhrA